MQNFRIESDSLGEIKIAKEAYYGANSKRALDNFPITKRPMDRFW